MFAVALLHNREHMPALCGCPNTFCLLMLKHKYTELGKMLWEYLLVKEGQCEIEMVKLQFDLLTKHSGFHLNLRLCLLISFIGYIHSCSHQALCLPKLEMVIDP